jgi:hypothetical protein
MFGFILMKIELQSRAITSLSLSRGCYISKSITSLIVKTQPGAHATLGSWRCRLLQHHGIPPHRSCSVRARQPRHASSHNDGRPLTHLANCPHPIVSLWRLYSTRLFSTTVQILLGNGVASGDAWWGWSNSGRHASGHSSSRCEVACVGVEQLRAVHIGTEQLT